MRTIEEIVQEIAATGRVTPLEATRRDIAKMLQGKRRHHTSTRRLMQPKEQPKHAVRNAFSTGNMTVSNKRPAGQKMDPWQ